MFASLMLIKPKHASSAPVPVLLSIAVTPSPCHMGSNSSRQCTATGTYDIGPTQNITTSCTWTSSVPERWTVTEHGGLVHSPSSNPGATITATLGAIFGTTFAAVGE